MEYVSVFVQELLKQLLPWMVSLLVAVAVKVIGGLWIEFRMIKPDKAEVLEKVARMAVYAAEQAQLNQMISDKKAYALDLAQRFILENYKLKLNLSEIDQAIEAEVGKMNVSLMENSPAYPPAYPLVGVEAEVGKMNVSPMQNSPAYPLDGVDLMAGNVETR